MRFGVHVAIAGGLPRAIERARELGCDAMQIFSRSPRSLRTRALNEAEAADFRTMARLSSISPIVVHIPYLINLASPKEQIYEVSISALREDIARACQLGADYLVIHPGSHVGSGVEAGMERIIKAINVVFKDRECRDRNREGGLKLLLETVSGAGTEIGYTFEQLKGIIENLEGEGEVGVCFDTCHVFAAGYDIRTPDGLNEVLEDFDRVLGLDRLKLVHANDSLGDLGSRKDRHAHIGEGMIGEDGFRAILNNERLREMPFILETPNDDPGDDARNLARLRELAGCLPTSPVGCSAK
ncbi:MAG TPA: deoxyribonuclease IV [Firmicutes bacterium]|nr:deoxyribonuclease IV [Bacillota bacterium]